MDVVALPHTCSVGLEFSVVIDSMMQASVDIIFRELVTSLPLEAISTRADWTHLQMIDYLVSGDGINRVADAVGRMVGDSTRNAVVPCRSLFDLFAKLLERCIGDGLFAWAPGGIINSELPEVKVSAKALLPMIGLFVQTIEVASVFGAHWSCPVERRRLRRS